MPDARHTLFFFSKALVEKWTSRIGDSAQLCESMRALAHANLDGRGVDRFVALAFG